MTWPVTTPSVYKPRTIHQLADMRGKLSSLEKSILKTLAYYESQGSLPLTTVELYRYLIHQAGLIKPSLIQVFGTLESLKDQGLLCQEKGLFFLSPPPMYRCGDLTPHLFRKKGEGWSQRVFRQKISIKKWKKLKKIAILLRIIPYLRGAMASGSLIFDNPRAESDIDLLVIARRGRIWTCRVFLSFFLEIIGQRRSAKLIKDKICLNHYLAEPWFEIKPQNLVTAQFYAHLVPLINYQVYQNFHKKNKWLANFLCFNFFDRQDYQKRTDGKKLTCRACSLIAKLFEGCLNNKLGDWLEKKLANWQIARIQRKTTAKKLAKDYLYLSDKVLLFHYPICRYAQVQNLFFKKIKALGLK